MAEWKAQINYNYNQSYHAYAYSLMYQSGSEQNHVNLSSWADSVLTDVGNNYTSSQSYYAPAAAVPQSPGSQPESPDLHVYSGHYQNAGMVYLQDTEANRLLLTDQPQGHEGRRTGSDSASDSEPQTSPDSWSSGSNGEACLPQADPATWAQKSDLDYETNNRSPDSNGDNPLKEKGEPKTYSILGNEVANNTTTSAPLIAPKNQSITKGKVRASFSESQMNALSQRFNVQRYLTPAEMKNLAELTGLTYKQVKTWFQNRRMKLRRHQKDNTWASERYAMKDNSGQGAAFANRPAHMQPYEGQTRPVLIEKTTPPNLALYLAAVGGAAASTAWSPNTAQNALHGRPQATSWPLPSDTQHFNYCAFNPPSLCTGPDTGFKEGEPINRGAHNTTIVQGTAQ